MGINSGPEFGSSYDGEVGILELERLDLMRELSLRVETTANEMTSAQINRDPILHTILSKLVEGGPELASMHRAHLRRMVALRLAGLSDIAARATDDAAFYDLAHQTVMDEIKELQLIPGAEGLPSLWDIALEDLLRLEGGEDSN